MTASPPIPPANLEALKADVLLLSVNEPPSPIAGRLREAIDEIARLRAENAELKAQRSAMDALLDKERALWCSDPQMRRLDQVRANIAGLRPGDAEAIAAFQTGGVHLLAEWGQAVEALRYLRNFPNARQAKDEADALLSRLQGVTDNAV
jgi:uncharacterized small protein (DUF1192 family)